MCQKKSRIYQTCNTQVRPKILYSWIQLCYTVKSSMQTVQANSLISRRTGRYLQTKSKWLIYNRQRQKIHGKFRLLCWRKYITPHYSSHSLAPKKARISVMYSVHRTTEEIYLSMAKEQNGSHIVEVIVINVIIDQPFKGSFFFFRKLPEVCRIIKHYDIMLFGISRMSQK